MFHFMLEVTKDEFVNAELHLFILRYKLTGGGPLCNSAVRIHSSGISTVPTPPYYLKMARYLLTSGPPSKGSTAESTDNSHRDRPRRKLLLSSGRILCFACFKIVQLENKRVYWTELNPLMCEGTKCEIYWHTFSQLIKHRLSKKVIPRSFFLSSNRTINLLHHVIWTSPILCTNLHRFHTYDTYIAAFQIGVYQWWSLRSKCCDEAFLTSVKEMVGNIHKRLSQCLWKWQQSIWAM